MLSDKYPIIIGIPPHQLSKEARRLFVFFSGRDNHQGHQQLLEDDVATEGIETARNDHQGGYSKAQKSRPATRGGDSTTAATRFAGAHPDPTYDDFETLLPDGNLAVPPCKIDARDEVTVISTPYIQVSDNEGDNLVRESSPVFTGKMRVKTRGRAARKPAVWSTDDEMEGKLPKDNGRNQVNNDDEGPCEVDTGKRKQRDDADGVAFEPQPKWARLTTGVTEVDMPVGDTSDRASAHGKGNDAFFVYCACTADQLPSHSKRWED